MTSLFIYLKRRKKRKRKEKENEEKKEKKNNNVQDPLVITQLTSKIEKSRCSPPFKYHFVLGFRVDTDLPF